MARSRKSRFLPTVCLALSVLFAGSQASAVSINDFKYDTVYTLTGSFGMGALGTANVIEGTLIYDSASKQLKVDYAVKNSKGTFDIDETLGAAKKSNDKVEFAFPSGAYMPFHGMEDIGFVESRNNFNIFGKNIAAGADLQLFGVGMASHIKADNVGLYFQSWVKIWGAPINVDIAWDPKVYLHEKPGNTAVPEPMTLGLLASGLLGGSLARRKAAAK